MGVYVKCSTIEPKFSYENELPEGMEIPLVEDYLDDLFNQLNPPAELDIIHEEIVDPAFMQREYIAQIYLQIMFVILLFLGLLSIYKHVRGGFF